jgi:hypothetical protein
VPESVQVTPAELLLAVAVSVTESPGSMLLADGAVIVTPTVAGGVPLPPQPSIDGNSNADRDRKADRRVLRTEALRRMITPGTGEALEMVVAPPS